MIVTQFQRRRPADKFSMEGYFQRVRDELEGQVELRQCVLPSLSKGIFRRVANMLSASRRQSDVNHITGDIHYIALGMKRSRTMLTVHDCQILERLKGWKRWIVKTLWYTLPARKVTLITVNSAETKRQLLKQVRFPEDRIIVVPVSVSERFKAAPRDFASDCPTLLQVGTKANKNLHRLAEAVSGLRCKLDILGTLSDMDLEILAEHKIQYRNYTELSDAEVVERYVAADIVCFASTHEGFGMPIVEAQKVERVCVTSNCSSMPEVAGDGAIFVDPFDVSSIRNGIERAIADADLRDRTIQAGRLNRQRFSSEQIAADFLRLYEQIWQENGES